MHMPTTIDPRGDALVDDLKQALKDIENHRFPPLVPGEDDDNDKVFFCPGCKQEVKEDHLIAEHNGMRKTILFTPDEDDWDDQRLWGNPQSYSVSEFGHFQKPLFYTHYTCGAKVSLPDGWELHQQ